MKSKKKSPRKNPKLTGRPLELAGRFIAEEITTGKYPRKQAVAIGISRARSDSKKSRFGKDLQAILDKYR